jgi:CelD/BcsL family acetyltransferase involved in cellulose biosynthesis
MLELAGQPRDGGLYRAVHAAGSWRFRVHEIAVEPYNDIELPWADLHAYFRSLAKKMRSNISRQARRLFAAGEVEFILAEGAAATTAWFDAYCDLDRRSWKHGTAASITRDPQRTRFFREIAAGEGGMEPAFVGIVLDGMLIAGLMLGSNPASPGPGGAWCLEMAYDQSRAELGPAQLLLLLAVKRAIEDRRGHLSFMQNFSHFKHRWGAQPIEVSNVTLIRRATLRNLCIRVRAIANRGRGVSRTHERPLPDHDRTPPALAAANAEPALQVQQRARALTAHALAAMKLPARRLDAAAARACLPFTLE